MVTSPVLDAPDYLVRLSANENQISMGALFQLIKAPACAGIAIALYPVLKKQDEPLALGAVGFRLIEFVMLTIPALSMLSLMTLSRE